MRSSPYRILPDPDLFGQRASSAPERGNPVVETGLLEEDETSVKAPWRVILYNDDVHTFDEVIHQLVLAIRCSEVKAEGIAWEVHTKGKAVVFEGDFEECFRVQSILREIELITDLRG